MCTLKSILFLFLANAVFCTKNSFAQSQKFFEKDSSKVTGNWVGTSVCQVKSSACRDESIEYNILEGEFGVYHVTMNKIVKGKLDFTGIVDCVYDQETRTLSSTYNGRIWQFTLNRDTIEGILIWRDQLYRKIHLQKK